MRAFAYTAFTGEGARKSGTIIAESDSHAAHQLKQQGLFVADLKHAIGIAGTFLSGTTQGTAISFGVYGIKFGTDTAFAFAVCATGLGECFGSSSTSSAPRCIKFALGTFEFATRESLGEAFLTFEIPCFTFFSWLDNLVATLGCLLGTSRCIDLTAFAGEGAFRKTKVCTSLLSKVFGITGLACVDFSVATGCGWGFCLLFGGCACIGLILCS